MENMVNNKNNEITQEEISETNTYLINKYLSPEFKTANTERENMKKTLLEFAEEIEKENNGINQFIQNVSKAEYYFFSEKQKAKLKETKNLNYVLELRKRYNKQKLLFRNIKATINGKKITRKTLSTPYIVVREIITNNGKINTQKVKNQITHKTKILYNHLKHEGITSKLQYRTATTELFKRNARIEFLKNRIFQLSNETGNTKQKAKTDKIKRENKPKVERLKAQLKKLI